MWATEMASEGKSTYCKSPIPDKFKTWAKEMAHWLKVHTAKPDNLSSMPRTHMVDGENQLPQIDL